MGASAAAGHLLARALVSSASARCAGQQHGWVILEMHWWKRRAEAASNLCTCLNPHYCTAPAAIQSCSSLNSSHTWNMASLPGTPLPIICAGSICSLNHMPSAHALLQAWCWAASSVQGLQPRPRVRQLVFAEMHPQAKMQVHARNFLQHLWLRVYWFVFHALKQEVARAAFF